MRQTKWIVFALALAMMAVTAALLQRSLGQFHLTEPGVKVSNTPIYDENSRLISTQSVVLPDHLPDLRGFVIPITAVEVTVLPADTTFGRRGYGTNHFEAQATVVLMGTDRASIHRPQWCLVGGGWDVVSSQMLEVPMTRPYRYALPVNKLLTSRKTDRGRISGVYVYWYVSKDKITAQQLSRLWSATWAVLTTGIRERWAYISYFAPCLPGQEQATFERLEKMIQDSVPEFQIVSGPRADQPTSMSALN
jgi:hypothetical protein